MSDRGLGHIRWQFAPFYRRHQGFGCLNICPKWLALLVFVRQQVWWAWPIRWVMVSEQRGMTVTDYYCTANEAACALAKAAVAARRRTPCDLT